jgi:hypothetical protein
VSLIDCNDSTNDVGSQVRVDFGGANQPKGLPLRAHTPDENEKKSMEEMRLEMSMVTQSIAFFEGRVDNGGMI